MPYSIIENDSQHKQTNCSQILDDLDATFDLRHEVRQKALPHPNFRHVTAFDMYEPEALCITDERFGSRERYRAFGVMYNCCVSFLCTYISIIQTLSCFSS